MYILPKPWVWLPLSFLALLLASCSGKDKKNQVQKDRVVPVEVFIAQTGSLDQAMTFTGTLLANESVSLHPELSGRLTGIHFTEGSLVTKGSLLIKLNDEDLQAQFRKLKINESLAFSDEQRKKKLLEIKGISQETYDQALTQYNSIKADIDLIQAQISKTEIRAPFTGIMGLRSVSEGSYVTAVTEVATLVQVQPLKLGFSVPENMAGLLKPGQDIVFRAEGNREPMQARIYAIEPFIDPGTRTMKVRALFQNAEGHLKPGGFVRVEVKPESKQETLLLPAQSIIPRLNGYDVITLVGGQVSRVPVTLRSRADSLVEIVDGIHALDTILITGLMQVKPGMKVSVQAVRKLPAGKGGQQ